MLSTAVCKQYSFDIGFTLGVLPVYVAQAPRLYLQKRAYLRALNKQMCRVVERACHAVDRLVPTLTDEPVYETFDTDLRDALTHLTPLWEYADESHQLLKDEYKNSYRENFPLAKSTQDIMAHWGVTLTHELQGYIEKEYEVTQWAQRLSQITQTLDSNWKDCQKELKVGVKMGRMYAWFFQDPDGCDPNELKESICHAIIEVFPDMAHDAMRLIQCKSGLCVRQMKELSSRYLTCVRLIASSTRGLLHKDDSSSTKDRGTSQSTYIFRESRDGYLIKFGEEKLHSPALLGMKYIYELLRRPGVYVSAADLERWCKVQPATADHSLPVFSESTGKGKKGTRAESMYDMAELAKIRTEIDQLKIEQAAARRNNDEATVDRLGKEIAHAIALVPAKPKNFETAESKQRGRVWKAIHDARERMKADGLQKFYEFLKKRINTDPDCIYVPDNSITWSL